MTGSIPTIKEPRGNPPMWIISPITGQGKFATASKISAFTLIRMREESELRYWPHPYPSVSLMLEALGIGEKRRHHYNGWRLTDYVLGHANHNPDMRGRMLATNGVMALLQGECGKVHEIHLDAFVHENNLDDFKLPTPEREAKPHKVSLMDFLA